MSETKLLPEKCRRPQNNFFRHLIFFRKRGFTAKEATLQYQQCKFLKLGNQLLFSLHEIAQSL
jgi:hypothetical protein